MPQPSKEKQPQKTGLRHVPQKQELQNEEVNSTTTVDNQQQEANDERQVIDSGEHIKFTIAEEHHLKKALFAEQRGHNNKIASSQLQRQNNQRNNGRDHGNLQIQERSLNHQ